MNIEIEWQAPFRIASKGLILRDRDDDFEEVPDFPGLYFFSRKWGDDYQPFYIGKATRLRFRLRQHLDQRKIPDALRGIFEGESYIPQGDRFYHFGILRNKGRQNIDECLDLVEKFMIQYAYNVYQYQLLNLRLKDIRNHEINFSGEDLGRGPFAENHLVPIAGS